MEIGKWEINNVFFVSFLVISAIAATIALFFAIAQNEATSPLPSFQFSYDFLNITELEGWNGNDVRYALGPIDSRRGVVILHPVSVSEPRYIEKSVDLPKGGSYELNVIAANIAGKAGFAGSVGCDDNIVALEAKSKKGQKRQEFTSNSRDGWVVLSMDVSEFSGQNVNLRVEGKAGGPCGDWAAEWGAVDRVYMSQSK